MSHDESVSPETETTTTQEEVAAPAPEEAVVTPEVETIEAAKPEAAESAVETDEVVEDAEDDEVVETDVDEDVVVSDEDAVAALEELIRTDPAKAAAEVRKLRTENANRRNAAKELEDTNSTITEFLTQLADPETRSEALALLAEVTGQVTEEAPVVEEVPEATMEEKIASIFQKREEALAVKAEQAKLSVTVTELGYNPEATVETDPAAFASHRLLWQFVAAQPEGQKDIKAAHAQVEAHEQAIFDRKLEALKAKNTGAPIASGTATSRTSEQDSDASKKSAYERSKELSRKNMAAPRS